MRKWMLRLLSLVSIALAVFLFTPLRAAAVDDDDDPPSRVARLAYTHGNVSFNPAGTDDWVSAVVNRPMTTGDKLWSDDGARTELHLGYAVIRLSDHTGFSFLNLADNITQIRLTEGTLNIRVRRLDDDETFEVDTPNLALSILRPGSYRINVNDAGDATIVAVRSGQGEITGGGSAYTIHAGEEGFFNGIEQLDADIQRVRDDGDDFDHWCFERDRREDRSVSSRYVSDDVVGYEDLDDYGGWRPVPEYGNVWFPHTTVVGWAPYRYGHWAWIAPWGWTWVDDEPWGFAPFHYGRWVVVGGVWGWVPCPPRPAVVTVAYVRPVYAPALVAWVGGAHWGVGVAVGGAPAGVAWFPLGPRDVYCPSYHVSQRYVERVNVSNTTIINKTYVTNVYNNVYVNKTVNVTNIRYQNQTQVNAVTATSHETFTSARSVHNNMIRVNAREVAAAPVAPLTPTVTPEQRSVLGSGTAARVRPPSPIISRPVVARTAPPPAPVAFTKQQQIVRENGGRPPAISEMRRVQQREEVQVERPNIRMAPPVRQGPPQNARDNRPDMQQGNPNRQGPPSQVNPPSQAPGQNVQNNRPDMQQGNPNRQGPPNNVNPPGQANRPDNAQENRPGRPGNPRGYNDRPPSSRQDNASNGNPRLEQKQQQQVQDLRFRQDQERQRVEQQQVQQRQKLEQNNPNSQRPPQADQRQQPPEQRQQSQVDQRQQPEQRQPEQRQPEQRQQPQVDQRQQQPDQRQQRQPDQRQQQTEQRQQQQADQRQQQLEQKQQRQLQQLEQKHDQQQQRVEQKQQQERQRQDKPAKQDKPSKPDKSDKPDKPHH